MSNARDKANIPALNFSSTGIDDNATSTAITIDSSQNVDVAGTLSVRKDGVTNQVVLKNLTAGSLASPEFTDIHFLGTSSRDKSRIRSLDVNSSAQGGLLRFQTSNANSTNGSSLIDRMEIASNGNISFYEDTGTTPKMRWDASTESLGIGTSSPEGKLHIQGDNVGTPSTDADDLVIEKTADTGLSILSTTTGRIFFGDASDNDVGRIMYVHTDDSMRFINNASESMRITSSGNVGIGTASPSSILHVSSFDPKIKLTDTDTGASHLLSGSSSARNFDLVVDDGGSSGSPRFSVQIQNSGKFYILNSGFVGINTTAPLQESAEKLGVDGGIATFNRNSGVPVVINRGTNDGELINFRQNGTQEGSISVSGSTVSYNGFTGTHWSRFQDNSKPTILRGTVLETLDEMCDWYNLEFDVTTTTQDEDGNDVETVRTKKILHVLADGQSEGDIVTYNHEGTDYQATIVKEGDVKHMMSKVSDTVDAKNVYGVFSAYDLDGEGYNDFYVASVGSFVVRIKANETIAKGDLLQSNGDGTAKVQIDDAVRSSSFAKVLSTTIIETYEDGSYLVPCSLMC
jgi:hypothetical protein